LFEQFSRAFDVDLKGLPAIGDSMRDLQAADSVGANPMLVETGKGAKTLSRYPDLDFLVFSNLYEASQYITLTQA
jgi:D-glycero-D-manno-heptose 1,7-bisphosphate phosphatase